MINSTPFIAKQLASVSSLVTHQQAIPPSAAFESLPVELQVKVLGYLPLSACLRTRQVSQTLRFSSNNTWLWLRRLNQYFPDWQQSLPNEAVKAKVNSKAYQVLFVSLYQQHFGGLAPKLHVFFQAVMEEDTVGIQQQLVSSPDLAHVLSQTGDTALHYAARYARVAPLRLLLDHGAQVDVENAQGQSPLHKAALYNRSDVIVILLVAGAVIDKRDNEDKSPLYYAIASGSLNCAYALLVKGANPEQHCAGWNALHTAAWHGQLELVQHLHQQGISIQVNASHDGCTPLHLAAWNNQMAVADYLLAQGAKVNKPNYDGFTPLHLAARSQHKAMTERLLQAGAKSSSQDYLGRTPLQLATLYQCSKTDEALSSNLRITCM